MKIIKILLEPQSASFTSALTSSPVLSHFPAFNDRISATLLPPDPMVELRARTVLNCTFIPRSWSRYALLVFSPLSPLRTPSKCNKCLRRSVNDVGNSAKFGISAKSDKWKQKGPRKDPSSLCRITLCVPSRRTPGIGMHKNRSIYTDYEWSLLFLWLVEAPGGR